MQIIPPVKTTIAVFAACCIGITTLFAYASTEQPSQDRMPPPKFEDMDANGDGQLSLDELKGPLAQDFDKFDSNGDGYLSQDELPAPPGQTSRPQ
ncbi:EF-hand domain-containing protein [Vibrio sp. TH_r3]|uniref:EF-hand domain-containing protein n=1 Tax=Vibrio sp. TH_r3 TaxID=3082084 RepID=UPI002953397E|nr:EF-hand domain-containing protein [Vibrio sp. TH_r3]MDV7103837.1 EF-hand domain-containing protein [Vibrio sp. TH_r3]